jgi:1,4-dihydroxy-6-naphthoate synthase
VVDLGAWWEERTGLPIPLGCIAAHQTIAAERWSPKWKRRSAGASSARANPDAALPYIRAHAQEMTAEVLRAHIDTFVNAFSIDLGPSGRKAVERLEAEARGAGILP